MNKKNQIPYRLVQSIRNRGIKKSFISAYSYFYDYYYDKKFKVDTHTWVQVDDLDVEECKKEHAVLYQPTRVLPLRKLFRELNLPSHFTFVDIGSGKGRVLLLASEFGFEKVIGIEFSKFLCSIAKNNINSFKHNTGTKTVFQVINDDASNYKYVDNENVFFLYNPFDEVILEKVIENIAASLKSQKRKAWMIYANAVHRDLIEKTMKIVKVDDYSFLEFDFVVYEVELLNKKEN